jgi:hypothetical protein
VTWFKVDDKFHGSDPVKRIPREYRVAAIGLWTLAGSWSSDHLKDGYVPDHIIDDLGGSSDVADRLCAPGVKLWRKVKGGYRFNDWAKWQPTREQVEEKRLATAKRVAEHRAKSAANKGDGSGDVTRYKSGVTPPPTRPDPTRPDLLKAHPLPADWKPTDEHIKRAREARVDVKREAEQFRLHAEANDRKAVRWNAAFSMWLSKAKPTLAVATVDWMNR